MSAIAMDDNTPPKTVKGKPRLLNHKGSYGAIKRRQPFTGFTARQNSYDNDENSVNMHGVDHFNNSNIKTMKTHGKGQSSEKSIYEKTLNMLMRNGQAAFENKKQDDDDIHMNIENEDDDDTVNDNVNNMNDVMQIERPQRTLDYYWSLKKTSHK